MQSRTMTVTANNWQNSGTVHTGCAEYDAQWADG
jgi:hypothetical protein